MSGYDHLRSDRRKVETRHPLGFGEWWNHAFWRAQTGFTRHYSKMLTLQLRELEVDHVISRKIFAEVPPRVEYQLAPYGCTLTPVLNEMAKWGIAHKPVKQEPTAIAD